MQKPSESEDSERRGVDIAMQNLLECQREETCAGDASPPPPSVSLSRVHHASSCSRRVPGARIFTRAHCFTLTEKQQQQQQHPEPVCCLVSGLPIGPRRRSRGSCEYFASYTAAAAVSSSKKVERGVKER